MKRYLVLALFFLGSLSAFSQAKPDTTLTTYIRTRNWVKITDTAALPKTIMPYYSKLVNYVKTSLPYQLKNTYVLTAHVRNTATELSIPITDINGILSHKKTEERFPKFKDTVVNGKKVRLAIPMFNGDPSGRQVTVIFNKASGKIMLYKAD